MRVSEETDLIINSEQQKNVEKKEEVGASK
jgi:hypothetical protein